ncbi:bifunctional coenzyme A synthase-like isoform X3 [Varroa jacobsoni]|uniref:Cytidyltransferase-like domain-containing protein n=1 Tax=Varroa destructor TaxID=109461 RepID=A0A7M7J347_VARDE|nr:bifunctional coenzyme A synthase-like isoform X3 [Varroa destructor]XP_022704918.1 bifunctional coenzyme A synthase-like isoform X3 [Varroa jacobsoni]
MIMVQNRCTESSCVGGGSAAGFVNESVNSHQRVTTAASSVFNAFGDVAPSTLCACQRKRQQKSAQTTSDQSNNGSVSAAMFHTGLVVIASPVRQILRQVAPFLREARQVVDHTLYIRLEPNYQWPQRKQMLTGGEVSLLRSIIPRIYGEAARECSHLDVRVLQSFLKNVEIRETSLEKKIEVVIAHKQLNNLDSYVKHQFDVSPKVHLFEPPVTVSTETNSDGGEPLDEKNTVTFSSVCLGGTFDRLHLGHKALLSSAVSIATEKLVVGVTDGDMIKNKLLWELIEPLNVRIEALRCCLQDMDPSLKYEIESISDPYGPTVRDASLQCLYVSDETVKGGLMINEERAKRNFQPMTLYNVSLVKNFNKTEEFMDDKISSSSRRIALLGKVLRKPARNLSIPAQPYVIGLTGGICSGKSYITKILEGLGVACISADLTGHEAYAAGTELNQELVDTFGYEIRAEDGSINRKALGAIIFSDASKRQRLNELVWPEIKRLLQIKVKKAAEMGARVVCIEAALLFEGGWDNLVHCVWYSVISEKEAIARVMKRDKCDAEMAMRKVRSQKPAKMFMDRSHVVLSTMWKDEVTQAQVERAYQEIQKYIQK